MSSATQSQSRSTSWRNSACPKSYPRALAAFFLLIVVIQCFAYPQSGRRPPRSKPVTTTTAEPVTKTDSNANPKSSRATSNHRLTRKVSLLIGRQFTSAHQTSEDTIYASFIQRLNEFTNVQGTSIGNLKRHQAIRRAREQEESFLVFLQFEVDNFQEGRLVLNSPDLEIKYFVYEPRSGKLKTKGKVYYQAIGGANARRDNWPTGTPIRITAEATGIETAERVHDWLLVGVGSDRQ